MELRGESGRGLATPERPPPSGLPKSTDDLSPAERRKRLILALVAVATFAIIAVATSLSDKAPGAIWRAKDKQEQVKAQVEERFGVDLPSLVDRNALPFEGDDAMHLFGWATGTVLVGFSLRRWVRIEELAVLVFMGSVLIEVAQPMYSDTRLFQLGDITTNALGVMCGLTAIVVLQRLRPIAGAP